MFYKKFVSILLVLVIFFMPATIYGENLTGTGNDNEIGALNDKVEISEAGVFSGDYLYEDISGGIKIVGYLGSGGNIDIPEKIESKTVIAIGADVFNGNTALTGVIIPNSVTEIGMRSFYNCPNLKSVFLGNGLITIGNGSFWGAASLTDIIVPANVQNLGYAAFANCAGLTKISFFNPSIVFGGDIFATTPSVTLYGYDPSTAYAYATTNSLPFTSIATSYVDVYYSTHVQNVGWQESKQNGEVSGTVGQGLRLEGITVLVDNSEENVSIQYRTHVQNIGWQDWVSNGTTSGTTGQSLRLEGIRIALTGTEASDFDVYYRVHAQNHGWLDWAKNGNDAGTQGLGLRLEGIQILVVPKNSAAPGSTIMPFVAG